MAIPPILSQFHCVSLSNHSKKFPPQTQPCKLCSAVKFTNDKGYHSWMWIYLGPVVKKNYLHYFLTWYSKFWLYIRLKYRHSLLKNLNMDLLPKNKTAIEEISHILTDNWWLNGNKGFKHLFTESQNKLTFPISLENASLMLYHFKFTIHIAKYI